MDHPISLQLQPKQKQNIKQIQRLMMSAQMQQALHFLQLPLMELHTLIETEMEQNPLLEDSEDHQDPELERMIEDESEENETSERDPEQELSFDDKDFEVLRQLDEDFRDLWDEGPKTPRTGDDEKKRLFQESLICKTTTLFEHLMKQAGEVFDLENEMKIAEHLIGNLDAFGFLQTPLKEIALVNQFDEEEMKKVLKTIQTFEPYGVGAADLRESLLIQLRCLGKADQLAFKIIENHFDHLLHNKILLIKKGLACSTEEIAKAIEETISKLDLHPGTTYSQRLVPFAIADAFIKIEGDGLKVEVNDESLPFLRLNSRYLKMLDDECVSKEAKDFIKQKILSAKWLMRNLDQRNNTIERIAKEIAKRQMEFLSHPEGKLVPMTMKMLAEELELHESTIARTVSSKYIETPRGLFLMRYFFTNAYSTPEGDEISSNTVREALLDLINTEDKKKPHSDATLSELLKAKGMNCARRTVAKYRAELHLGNAQQRRKFIQNQNKLA
jgi:RNA polymerase sigma-54 factor